MKDQTLDISLLLLLKSTILANRQVTNMISHSGIAYIKNNSNFNVFIAPTDRNNDNWIVAFFSNPSVTWLSRTNPCTRSKCMPALTIQSTYPREPILCTIWHFGIRHTYSQTDDVGWCRGDTWSEKVNDGQWRSDVSADVGRPASSSSQMLHKMALHQFSHVRFTAAAATAAPRMCTVFASNYLLLI